MNKVKENLKGPKKKEIKSILKHYQSLQQFQVSL